MSTPQNPPSLDLGKNNSTPSETSEIDGSDGSERYDCRDVYSNFRVEADTARDGESEPPTAEFRCNQWDCYCCGYRMRQNLIEEIQRVANARPEMSRLLTLTLDPDYAPDGQDEQHTYITERWNALRTRLKREVGDFSYIWVREEQENGLPHLHAIVSRYLPQEVVANAWDELGGGQIVDIRKIEHVDKAAHYVGKYLTKDALSGLPDGIRRYGTSSDIELNVRGSDGSERSFSLVMDDYMITRPDGEPLTRGVTNMDFVQQRQNGGPLGEPPPTD